MTNKRTQDRIAQNLGVVGEKRPRKWRSDRLKNIENHYYNRQHDDKVPWFDAEAYKEEHIEINRRKPLVVYPLAKIHCSRIAAKLFGEGIFPELKVEDNDKLQGLIDDIVKKLKFRSKVLQASKPILALGSGFLRIKNFNGYISFEEYSSNICYPMFDDDMELVIVRIQYVYDDEEIIDPETEKPLKRWYKLVLTRDDEILFDNPPYDEGAEPEFKVVQEAHHGLGVVQGEWIKTTYGRHKFDGESLVEDILDLGDCISYNITQSDRASSYGTDPQLTIKGLDGDELEELVKSKEKAWALGREGEAQFIELGGNGVVTAGEVEKRLQQKAQEVTRAIQHDPEKIIGSAQSAKAMEVLNGPLVEVVKELRPAFGDAIVGLMKKIITIITKMGSNQFEVPMLAGVVGEQLDITLNWGDIFPRTTEDLQQEASLWTQLTSSQIVSKETALKKLAPLLGIDNVEEELKKIAAQPVDDGGFYGGQG